MLDRAESFASEDPVRTVATRLKSGAGRPKAATLAARVEAIRRRHRALEQSVETEHMRPLPDVVVLQSLKREKLRLKDEMQVYEGLLRILDRARVAT